jgi:diguanylate cyclase (GGDEF)-like protein/PAS domain S-box-containing protein
MSSRPSRLAAYADLFQRMLDPTFLVDPATQVILEVNPAGEALIGEGGSITDLVLAEGRDEFAKGLRVSMRRYHPRLFESRWQVAGRTLIFEIVACPLHLSDGTDVLQIIARDITFRREAEEKLKILSTVDEMTGLFNFRHFKGVLAQEHARARRASHAYSVVFCDIDHFKHYNDRNGHPAGDALLEEMARILQKCTRNTDYCVRYGGEEFVVLCPETDAKQALVVAERIRSAVAKHDFAHAEAQPAGHLSFSIGVASFPEHGLTAEMVLHQADQAMYHSKTHGRDQVTVAQAEAKAA